MNDDKRTPGTQNGDPVDWDEIGRTVETEVRRAVGTVMQSVQTAAGTVTDSLKKTAETNRNASEFGAAANRVRENVRNRKKNKKVASHESYAKQANGAVSAGGGMALPAAIMTVITLGTLTDITEPGDIIGTLIIGVIAAWLAFSSFASFRKGARLRTLAAYFNLLGERSSCTVPMLASATGKTEKTVRRDLQRAVADGTLQTGWYAPDADRLFSSETAYRMYLSQQEAAEQTKREKSARAEEEATPSQQTLLEECRGFAQQLRSRAELIDDAAVTTQVDTLAAHTQRIIAWLENHPGQEQRVRRFASYYLPTAIKLLDTYIELEPHAVPGSVAAGSRAEIANILTTINGAFQTLEDSLVANTAMHVSAEISALETVMAQEGLTGDTLGMH